MSLTARAYEGHSDLALMVRLQEAVTAARWPLLPPWHRGDVIWNTYTAGPGSDRVWLWFAGGDLSAYAVLVGPDEMHIELGPAVSERRGVYEQAIEWAEGQIRRGAQGGEPASLSHLVMDSDPERARALVAAGYHKGDTGGVRMRRALDVAIQEARLPAGMRVGDCVRVDVEERAAAHRDAWSHLEHIGMPGVRSNYSAERYLRLRSTPGYDPSLDLVVEAPGGAIAASCICWADEANGIGLFEPVGTRFAYRRQGLARALVLEGLRRFRARGMHTALIGTASFNQPAEAAYLSCGFEIVDREWQYSRTIIP